MPADLPAEVLRDAATAGMEVARDADASGVPAPAVVAAAIPATPAQEEEAHRVRSALETHRWRREEAARALGVSRTTLWRKMRELGLSR